MLLSSMLIQNCFTLMNDRAGRWTYSFIKLDIAMYKLLKENTILYIYSGMRQNLILGNNTFIAFLSLVTHVYLTHWPVLSGGFES